MRILTGLIILFAAGATAASAQPKASDAQYIQASRCAGLASSASLGGDAGGYDGWLKANAEGRQPFIAERADQARRAAHLQANRAGDLEKQKLTAELASACSTFKG